jgi:hypothetical protein
VKKVSFDYDQCLGEYDHVVMFARNIIENNKAEVWIVTTRWKCGNSPYNPRWNNNDLFLTAEDLDIPRSRIVFTEHADKYRFFTENPDFVWHLDDDTIEIELINEHTDVIGIHAESEGWQQRCENLIAPRDFYYCQRAFEFHDMCVKQCDHCKIYYASLEKQE